MKDYLWTKIDYDDPSTWPEPDQHVAVAAEVRDKPGFFHLGFAQARPVKDLKSLINWTKVKRLYWRGPRHFKPTHWRRTLDIDYPNDMYYKDGKSIEEKKAKKAEEMLDFAMSEWAKEEGYGMPVKEFKAQMLKLANEYKEL